MAEDPILRMLEWFPALGRLSPWTRARLVPLLHGHPRAVEFLDGFVHAEMERWENDHGPLSEARDPKEAEEEWQRFVQPVLEATQQKLRDDLLFDALWERVLRPLDRRLLVRISILRRPARRGLVLALAEAPDQGRDSHRLRDTGLLVEDVLRDAQGRTESVFAVHPLVAEFARRLAPEWDTWRKEAFRLAADFLDQQLKAESAARVPHDAADVLDAGF